MYNNVPKVPSATLMLKLLPCFPGSSLERPLMLIHSRGKIQKGFQIYLQIMRTCVSQRVLFLQVVILNRSLHKNTCLMLYGVKTRLR